MTTPTDSHDLSKLSNDEPLALREQTEKSGNQVVYPDGQEDSDQLFMVPRESIIF